MAYTSCANLAELEYEFASNPNSEAFIPLAEAYLSVGRYVEAMVVCKKGIRTHPELPTGRIIMARIYTDQGKHQKAVEELLRLLNVKPDIADACCLLGDIYLKLGKQQDGINTLKKALDADPKNQHARETLLKIGIDHVPGKRSDQTQKEPANLQTPSPKKLKGDSVPTAVSEGTSEQSIDRWMEADSTKPVQKEQRPAVKVSSAPSKKRIADIYQAMEARGQKPKQRGIRYTLYLVGALVMVLIVYIIYTWQAGVKQEEINQHLELARPLFNHDTYNGYMKALDHYRAILKLDSKHAEALSRGAFICAVLVGEYQASRNIIDEATKYINKAMADEQNNVMLTVARGLVTVYGGGMINDAVKLFEDALKEDQASAVLHTNLGITFLRKGELDAARDHLLVGAQQSEIRAFMGLGLYARRRSMYREAEKAFNRALQVDRNHTGALLEKSMLALIWGETAMYNKQASEGVQRFKSEIELEASEGEKAEASLIEKILKSRNSKNDNPNFSDLKEFTKKHSNNAVFQFVLAREMRRNGLIKESKTYIERALRLDSSRPNFVLEEAEVYLAMKDWEAARSRALRVQEMGQSLLIVGQAYLGERNFEKAKQYFKDATEFEDVAAKARRRLADVYLSQPKPDEDLAQAQLEPAVRALLANGEYRESAESAVMLAKIYAKKNLRNKFLNILKEALKADPTFAEPHCLIAVNIDKDTKEGKDQVREYCGKCIKLDPSSKVSQRCKDILRRIK